MRERERERVCEREMDIQICIRRKLIPYIKMSDSHAPVMSWFFNLVNKIPHTNLVVRCSVYCEPPVLQTEKPLYSAHKGWGKRGKDGSRKC